MFDLKGKVVLITGGATGIGFSCVQQLLSNGVKGVTIADINVTNGEEALKNLKEFGPKKAIFVKTDVTKLEQLEAAFKVTIETWKTVDIVINNAGIMNDGQWEFEISLNCNAVVQGTLLGLQYMGKDNGGKGGVIVNMSSVLGLQPLDTLPIYTGTKHFVVGFSRSFGTPLHYNRTGVKILTLCPGGTNTSLLTEAVRIPLNNSSEVGNLLGKQLDASIIQPTENVSRGMITLITKGENGSVWTVENDEPIYEVHIPDRKTLKRSQLN